MRHKKWEYHRLWHAMNSEAAEASEHYFEIAGGGRERASMRPGFDNLIAWAVFALGPLGHRILSPLTHPKTYITCLYLMLMLNLAFKHCTNSRNRSIYLIGFQVMRAGPACMQGALWYGEHRGLRIRSVNVQRSALIEALLSTGCPHRSLGCQAGPCRPTGRPSLPQQHPVSLENTASYRELLQWVLLKIQDTINLENILEN
jgi:hypothetical protein